MLCQRHRTYVLSSIYTYKSYRLRMPHEHGKASLHDGKVLGACFATLCEDLIRCRKKSAQRHCHVCRVSTGCSGILYRRNRADALSSIYTCETYGLRMLHEHGDESSQCHRGTGMRFGTLRGGSIRCSKKSSQRYCHASLSSIPDEYSFPPARSAISICIQPSLSQSMVTLSVAAFNSCILLNSRPPRSLSSVASSRDAMFFSTRSTKSVSNASLPK